MSFWRKVSPTGAVKEFAAVWTDNPLRWRVLAVSILLSFGFFYFILPRTEYAEPRRPRVVYVTDFAPGRSDAEIIASNIENQKRKQEALALEEKRAEFRKDAYRALGRATFIDTDAMEREIARDKAAEEAAAKARREAADKAWAGRLEQE